MKLTLTLKQNKKTGTFVFYISSLLAKDDYSGAFSDPKLVEGKRYNVTIEEAKE